jgi:hypothetical protein
LWHADYRRNVVSIINDIRPDVLIIFGSSVFKFLPSLTVLPKRIIYHAYEFISNLPAHDIEVHRHFLPKVDLIITPEIDRLIIDTATLGVYPNNIAMIYNTADVSYPSMIKSLPPSRRNGRFVWFGTLNRRQAYAEYFYSNVLSEFDIDLFGRITDPDLASVEASIRSAANLRYFGVVDAVELNERRAENIFSLVWWNPEISAGHYYVSPNRLFTSIQAGVPPICAPHPQCIDIVNRFGCGIIMEDWSVWSVQRAMRRALKLYESDAYAQMVKNCADASMQFLNWDSQFDRIRPRIAAALDGVMGRTA